MAHRVDVEAIVATINARVVDDATIDGISDVDGLDLSKRGTSKPTIGLVHAR